MSERTIIIDAVIKVLVLLFTVVLIPRLNEWLERNRDVKEIQLVLTMAKVAVGSVENDLKTETGLAKKNEAISRLAKQIESWGVTGFTDEELNHYIELAVRELWKDDPQKDGPQKGEAIHTLPLSSNLPINPS